MINALNKIKPYSQILKRMMNSVCRLLLIDTLILIIVLYTITFTDAQRHRDFYLNDSIFNGLILYLILFPCIKALIHLSNLYIFRTKLDCFKMQIVEFISEYDYIIYIKKPLRRIQVLFLIYPFVILTHVVIAFACYYLKNHRL